MCQEGCNITEFGHIQNPMSTFIHGVPVTPRLHVRSDWQPVRLRRPPQIEPLLLRLLPAVRTQRRVGEAVQGGRRWHQDVV